jgi:Bifunctional DNA primase/polymerase, N-terminal
MLATLPRFACRNDKTPLVRWTTGARSDVDDSDWELVGVPTGSVTGFDCLDIDLEGLNWLSSVCLPPTRIHETRSGGRHLLFRHAEGLRNSAGRIARGIDVRGDGGFIIWWPARGFRVLSDAEIADWPEFLLAKALHPSAPCGSDDGIGSEIRAWSLDGLTHPHGLYHGADGCTQQVKPQTLNLRARSKSILRKIEHAKPGERNRLLNWGAYRFGQIVAEGLINPDIAGLLLEQGAKSCGLWRDDGPSQCQATIKSGIAAGIRDASDRMANVIPLKRGRRG